MPMKLYVGNLAYTMMEEELGQLFLPYGEVQSVNLIKDRSTNRSKGFGFVEMATPEQGEAAIKDLNGKTVKERAIIVNEAHNEKSGPGTRGNFARRNNRRRDE